MRTESGYKDLNGGAYTGSFMSILININISFKIRDKAWRKKMEHVTEPVEIVLSGGRYLPLLTPSLYADKIPTLDFQHHNVLVHSDCHFYSD